MAGGLRGEAEFLRTHDRVWSDAVRGEPEAITVGCSDSDPRSRRVDSQFGDRDLTLPRDNMVNVGVPPLTLILRSLLVVLLGTVWWTAMNDNDFKHSDATGDWIFINSLTSGLSPSEGLTVLGSQLDVAYWDEQSTQDQARTSYRTPGGLLLLSPLLLVKAEHAHLAVNIVGLVAFAWLIFYAVPRICRRSLDDLILPIALAITTVAFSDFAYWGNVSPIVAALSAWILLNPRSTTGGGLLGIATLMKLYPGLIGIPLLVRKTGWRAALVCAGVFGAANLLGAAVFRFPLEYAIRLILGGAEEWQAFTGNTSIGALLLDQGAPGWIITALTMGGIVAVVVFARVRPLSASLLFASCVAVLVSPVSWTHYGLLVLPAVIFLWSRGSEFRLGRIVSGSWLLVGVLTNRAAELLGWETTRGVVIVFRIALALAVALAPVTLWHDDEALEKKAVPAMRPSSTELALQ